MNDIETLKQHCVETHNTHKICFTYNDEERIWSLIQRNKDLEQIEKEHKEENGKLRDRIKELEIEKENEFKRGFFTKVAENKANTIKIESQVIPIFKIKEIVDDCIPKKENIITRELEYTPNANANSFLTQRILELLEESEK